MRHFEHEKVRHAGERCGLAQVHANGGDEKNPGADFGDELHHVVSPAQDDDDGEEAYERREPVGGDVDAKVV